MQALISSPATDALALKAIKHRFEVNWKFSPILLPLAFAAASIN